MATPDNNVAVRMRIDLLVDCDAIKVGFARRSLIVLRLDRMGLCRTLRARSLLGQHLESVLTIEDVHTVGGSFVVTSFMARMMGLCWSTCLIFHTTSASLIMMSV